MKNKYLSIPKEMKASVWYTVCSIVQKSIGLLTVPIFTRLLTTEDYGLTNVYNTWLSMIAIFATLNLQYGSFNTAMVKFEEDRERYISSIQSLVTLITVVVFAILLLFCDQVSQATGLPTVLIAIMGIEILAQFAFGLWVGKKRFDFEYKGIVAITLLVSALIPILGIAMVLSVETGRGEMRILSMVLVQFVFYSVLYFYNAKRGKCFFDRKFWKYALGMNLVLLPYYLAQMAFNSSDLLMINQICGMADAGLYGVAYSFAVVLTFVISAISNSFIPWKYRKIKEGDLEPVPNTTNALALLVACMMSMLILIGPEIMIILAAPQYFEARWIIPPVAASMFFLFLTQVFVDIEFLFEARFMLVLGSLVAAITNIVLNAIFLPQFGYIAAGYTTLASYILFWLCNWLSCRQTLKRTGLTIRDICDMKTLTILAVVMIGAMFACVLLYQAAIARYIVVLIGCVCAIIFRKKIIGVVKGFRG
ncbi:oligosaccharide flippase family protein [Adlercreutzia sp. ZJ304]|uniref:lipopolysaccharide biosynthesis protein n=1 Tax=Adlercreutzia sp. ZJ304 TaxID=2709791 RepID=UPI0013EDAC29|nr:oligosaccharide flippase family protein [Adlercreutzia sp. ZJ304]